MKIATILIGLLAVPSAALAQLDDAVPVIEPGREREVLALFAPHRLAREVTGGVVLANVRIEPTRIVAELSRDGAAVGEVALEHRGAQGEPARSSASFAITWSVPPGDEDALAAARAVTDAVVRNDPGGFFRVHAMPPAGPGIGDLGRRGGAWVADGTLLFLAALVLLLAIVGRQLSKSSRETAAILLAITTAGAIYRLWLAPETVLGAWPYSRTVPIYARIWEGPALSWISAFFDAPIAWFDFATTTTLLFAIVTPIALFAHARDLLGSDRRALLAAAIVAGFPNHVRFSHSEVEFIPSLALAAFTFVLLHVMVRDESRAFRVAAAIAVPLAAWATFVTRPLNVVFLPLFLVDLWALSRERARWRLAAAALVSATGIASVVLHLLPYYSGQVRDGSDPAVLWQALGAVFSLKWNTLIHPGITPPVLALAAIVAVAWHWRSERRLVAFLLAWLGLFFVTHAYVLPEETAMQARYHLHLVAPFVLLGALGLDALLDRKRAAGVLAVALVALSPLVHLDFVRDVAFNDQREFALVREAAEVIEPGCTVLEHTGEGTGDHDARFARVGTVLEGFRETRRWRVQPIGAPEASEDPLRPEARAVLEGGGCVVYYEGIPCFSERRDDEPIARACAAMRREVPLSPIAGRSFESRLYDANLDPRMPSVRLTVYRVGREELRPRRSP